MTRRGILRAALGLTALAVAGAAGAGWWLTAPYAGFATEQRIDIPRGAGLTAMAQSLAESGVIRHRLQFYLIRALRPNLKLQAGEYSFRTPDSAWGVYGRIARGDIFFTEVLFPEGSNLFDMSRILSQTTHIKAEDFLRVARDPKLIQDLAPNAPSLEGFLFPASYRVTKSTTAESLAKEMTGSFRRVWKETGGNADALRTVTLASLVEKETGLAEERSTVASVYLNRLDRNIKLECDPTTIYAALLENRYDGVIHRSDLNSQNPYNTYQHLGLPPGPIANPGKRSLEAVLKPAQTDFIFFVAKPDGSGGHVFTTNLDDHTRAVANYRRGNQKGTAQ